MTTPTCATCELWVGTEERESSYLGDCLQNPEQQHRTAFDDCCPHWRKSFANEPVTTRVASEVSSDMYLHGSFVSGSVPSAFAFEMQATLSKGDTPTFQVVLKDMCAFPVMFGSHSVQHCYRCGVSTDVIVNTVPTCEDCFRQGGAQ